MKSTFKIDQNNSEQDELISEINVTPLVDVMLLLMVIFLITAPLLINQIDVNLPKISSGSLTKQNINKTITIKEDGKLLLEKKLVTLSEIEHQLALINDSEELIIEIAADQNARYQQVASVLAVLSKNRVANIRFLTQN